MCVCVCVLRIEEENANDEEEMLGDESNMSAGFMRRMFVDRRRCGGLLTVDHAQSVPPAVR